ncbi:MAG: response regulator [Cyclobacteriaceae bacterium]|nr:response regulator [Cyclobacteriaceae bacterium]
MKKIIYVEDDRINAFIVESFLRGRCDIKVVTEGETCIELLSKNVYDLILMDINLGNGKMDGVETLKIIKGDKKNADLPVIALTSYANPADKENFIKEGFTSYLAKPVSKEDLITEIKTWIEL